MRLVRFMTDAGPRLGLLETAETVVDLVVASEEAGLGWFRPVAADLRLFLAGGARFRAIATELADRTGYARRRYDQLQLLAPFEQGSKIIAHVVNYLGHDTEAKVKVPAKPFFFQKPGSSVTHPGQPIMTHQASRKPDHEIEIGILIGKAARNIRPEDALDHVAGFTVLNDVSYRDLQMNEGFPDLNTSYGKNWTQAKGMDASCPMGPVLVLRDEMPEPYPLRKVCRVNGVIRQDANSADMIHKVPALVAEASRGITLWPGDVIATGTPAGSGLGDGLWLKPGDIVECEIEGIGTLSNPVIADPLAA